MNYSEACHYADCTSFLLTQAVSVGILYLLGIGLRVTGSISFIRANAIYAGYLQRDIM